MGPGVIPLGRRGWAVAAALLGGALASAPAGQRETVQPPRFAENILVERVIVEARVVDRAGRPIATLAPADFRVEVGGRPVPLESAEWVAEGSAGTAPAEQEALPPSPPDRSPRLVVLFVQADHHPSRLSGLMRMWPKVSALLATLSADDLVSVVSFDSHLKLHCDFTTDRAAVRAALRPTAIFREPVPLPPQREPSLAAHLAAAEALAAASPERGLALTARALEALPGTKTMVFLGWGLGRLSRSGVRLPEAYAEAIAAMSRGRVTVLALDVTDADAHSLEVGLQRIAQDTGGFYARTHLFPDLAVGRVAGVMAGHYELVFARPDLPPGPHRVTVRLHRTAGTVLVRPTVLD